MTEEFRVARLPLSDPEERARLEAFLERHGLRLEADIQTAFGVLDSGDRLVACGCAGGDLLKCFAVEPRLRGQNAVGLLVSALTRERFSAGVYDLFVVTRRENEKIFQSCGFFPVVHTSALSMLENRPDGPAVFAAPLKRPGDERLRVGAVVMNCNPFTLGHQVLVEFASRNCDVLYLFVVEEERSLFPTAVRYELARAGTAHLPNVRVHLSGRYMISAATFPTYFLKENEDGTKLQVELDITLFSRRIAPALHISVRFAGQEPLDSVTAEYNRTMEAILPQYGVQFCEIPRTGWEGQVISASRVRRLLEERGVCEEVLSLVPETTARYLRTEYGVMRHEAGTDF